MNKEYENLIEKLYEYFKNCPAPEKREKADGWSVKEVVGHLIDSVSNNHQRLVRFTTDNNFHFPGYEQNEFVRRANYHNYNFHDLITLWYSYNKLLLHIIESIPEENLKCLVTREQDKPMTISELIQSYYDHLINHKKQVGRILAA
jgi:DinB superfamily